MNRLPDMKHLDTLAIAVAAVEAFSNLPWDEMSHHARAGALLMFNALTKDVDAAIPPGPDFDHVRRGLRTTRDTAQMIQRRQRREAAGEV